MDTQLIVVIIHTQRTASKVDTACETVNIAATAKRNIMKKSEKQLRSTIHRGGTIHGERTQRIHLISRWPNGETETKCAKSWHWLHKWCFDDFCIFISKMTYWRFEYFSIFVFWIFCFVLCCLFSCFSIAIRWVDLCASSEWSRNGSTSNILYIFIGSEL